MLLPLECGLLLTQRTTWSPVADEVIQQGVQLVGFTKHISNTVESVLNFEQHSSQIVSGTVLFDSLEVVGFKICVCFCISVGRDTEASKSRWHWGGNRK